MMITLTTTTISSTHRQNSWKYITVEWISRSAHVFTTAANCLRTWRAVCWRLCLVSSVTFPFIRSNRMELYFFRFRRYQAWNSAHSEARETRRPPGPTDNSTRPFAYTRRGNGYGRLGSTALRQRRYGTAARTRVTETVTETDIRMNGNATFETRR